jgi:hypothetical protein
MRIWRRAAGIVAIWLWFPAFIGLLWLLFRWIGPGTGGDRAIALWVQRWFFPNGPHLTGWFWIWVAIHLVITAIVVGVPDEYMGPIGWGWSIPAIAAVVVLVWPFPSSLWDNDKDLARYYNKATVIHVPSLSDPPASVTALLTGARQGGGGCARVSKHDVPSCIVQDNGYASMRWESRTSGLASARTAMTQAASQAQGVDVMAASMTYVWGSRPNTGQWSAILDGSGSQQPVYGIAQWDGESNATTVCRFTGDHKSDRAFGGSGMNNLRHLLAEKYPRLFFDDDDVRGYCSDDRPVIVISVMRQVGFKNRTAQVAAGVLVLRGTPDGHPDITYQKTVKPGDFPVPTYPIALARVQRGSTAWAAGRRNHNENFGFQVSDFETQKANPGEYNLRGADGRLYYVTPLTPRGTQSQAFVAYGIVANDEVTNGRLNRYDLYVQATNDPSIANLASLNAKASLIGAQNGASLEGYIPLGGDRWRVYGVRNGQTVFYINLSVSDQLQPETVLSGQGETQPQPSQQPTQQPSQQPSSTDCGKPPGRLDNKQLAKCIADLGDELRRRNGG